VNTIRDATLEDAALIASLNGDVQAIHAAGLPHYFKPPVLDQTLIDEFRSMMANKDCFFLIAEADDMAAGYVFAEFMSRQESARVHGGQMLYIHHISVNAEFRLKGLGRSLLEEARKRALHAASRAWRSMFGGSTKRRGSSFLVMALRPITRRCGCALVSQSRRHTCRK
jgi:ribosomal protein S18 acetylase RimI-like enzyme